MPNINIIATKSITISSRFPNKTLNEEKVIIVGSKNKYIYYSFLFFDLSMIQSASIKSATLVLFKTDDYLLLPKSEFYIMPLLNPFSSFTTYNNRKSINVDKDLAVNFCPFVQDVSVQVDITAIVNNWLTHKLPNCGLVLGKHKSPYNEYIFGGSAYSKDNTIIPFININCAPNIFCLVPPPSGATCTVNLIKNAATPFDC
jgi:hypothetical protein